MAGVAVSGGKQPRFVVILDNPFVFKGVSSVCLSSAHKMLMSPYYDVGFLKHNLYYNLLQNQLVTLHT